MQVDQLTVARNSVMKDSRLCPRMVWMEPMMQVDQLTVARNSVMKDSRLFPRMVWMENMLVLSPPQLDLYNIRSQKQSLRHHRQIEGSSNSHQCKSS